MIPAPLSPANTIGGEKKREEGCLISPSFWKRKKKGEGPKFRKGGGKGLLLLVEKKEEVVAGIFSYLSEVGKRVGERWLSPLRHRKSGDRI